MRLYVAGPWTQREKAREAALRFETAGHTITQRWWDHEDIGLSDPLIRTHAVKDFLGVAKAQALVVLQYELSEGKAVETGIALVRQLPIVVVKPDGATPANIFQSLPNFFIVESLDDAIALLTEITSHETRIHLV